MLLLSSSFFLYRVMFLLKVMLIYDEPLLVLARTPRVTA